MRRITALATAACLLAIPAMAQPAGNDRLATAAQLRDAALAGNKAWGLLSSLTDTVGQRLAGTEAEARGRAWAKAEMQKLGLVNIREEAFPLTLWERGQASATIVGTTRKKIMTVSFVGNWVAVACKRTSLSRAKRAA